MTALCSRYDWCRLATKRNNIICAGVLECRVAVFLQYTSTIQLLPWYDCGERGSMAYPGNLYALVARDQHVKSRTTVVLTVDSLTNDNILTSKTKTSSTRGKHRSTRANVKRTPNDDYDTAGRKKTLLLYPAVSRAREFRITRVSSNQAPVGAKAWRIDPSEYGQRMDTNSICELRDAFRTHTVSHIFANCFRAPAAVTCFS